MQTDVALTAVLSDDGQVTLPEEVLEALGARAGDYVEFRQVEPGKIVLAVRRTDIRSLVGILRQYARPEAPLTVEEMNQAIGDAVVELYERSIQ